MARAGHCHPWCNQETNTLERDRVLEKEMKPHLVITEERGEVPVRGTCSACPDEIFAPPVIGDRSYNLALLQELFDEHFKKVHVREDDMSRTTPKD